MGERLTDKSVVDRSAHPGAMIYVDAEGFVCKANRPTPLSVEEKARREAERKAKKAKIVGERSVLRDAMRSARKSALKYALTDKAEEYRRAYEDAKASYDKVMGR